MALSSWSGTASSNANVEGTSATNIQEGSAPSAVNNAIRQVMADVVNGIRDVTYQVYLPAAWWTPTVTNGAGRYVAEDATNDIMEDSLAFDTSTQEFATIDLVLPKRWNIGTLTFQPYWRTTGGGAAETVVFGFTAVAVGNDDAADATLGTEQTSSDTWIADTDVHIGPVTSALTAAGTPADGDVVRIKVSRNVASDNLAGDARLQGVLLHFTSDAASDA